MKKIETITPSDLAELELEKNSDRDEQISNTREFIETLIAQWYNENNIDQRSYITHRNEKGIIKALNLNKFLEETFGFRNIVLDELVKQKLFKSKSVHGKSTEHLINFAQSMGLRVETAESSDKSGGFGLIK